ncbi:MAG: hypothetical protein ABIA74_05930 [bacterium]
MILLGLAAFIQVVFLPGFLFLKIFNRVLDTSGFAKKFSGIKNRVDNLNFLQIIIFSFALSLIINYLFVSALALFSFYTRSVMFSMFFLEILLFIYLQGKNTYLFFNQNLLDALNKNFKKVRKQVSSFIFDSTYNLSGKNSWILNFVTFFSSLICIYWVFVLFVSNFTSFNVFTDHDSIVSWNKWALDFFNNYFPVSTLHYPQLIPANWSIFYKFIGEPIQYFPKTIMPLFSLFLLLLMFDLGLRKKSIGYFLGVITTTLYLKNAIGWGMTSGLVDVPVAFMSFLSIYCLLLAGDFVDDPSRRPSSHRHMAALCRAPSIFAKASMDTQDERGGNIKQYLFFGIIFVFGSCLIKQAGLYVFLIYPILFYFLIFKKRKDIFTKEYLQPLIVFYLVSFLALVLPFYLYAHKFQGSEVNAVVEQAALYEREHLLPRLLYAIKTFLSYNVFFINVIHNKLVHFIVGVLAGLLYLALLLSSLFDRNWRYLFLFFLIPYSLIWSFFLCYDFRNYSVAIPIYGLCLGIGFERFLYFKKDYFLKFFALFKYVKISVIALPVIAFIIFINFKYPLNYLRLQQQDFQLKKDNEKLNRLLLEYKNLITPDKKLLTTYILDKIEPLKNIPHCLRRFSLEKGEIRCNVDRRDDFLIDYKIGINDPQIGYLLISNDSIDEIKNDILHRIKKDKFKLIFNDADYFFVEKLERKKNA